MKIFKILIGVFMVAFATLLSDCSNSEDSPDPADEFRTKISGTWNIQSVKIDNIVVTRAFEGMTLTLQKDGTFTTVNSIPPIWPASGTFTIVQAGETYSLKRSDDVTMIVSELGTNAITLKFNYTNPSGRTTSVNGAYEFIFVR